MYLKYLSDMKNISRVMPYAKSTNIAMTKQTTMLKVTLASRLKNHNFMYY